MKPCIQCGTPTERTRCPECSAGSTTARGYGHRWQKLSRKARALQPFCSVPGCTSTDLTADHIGPEAWERYRRGLPLRLGVDVDVLCRKHNGEKGAARYGSTPREFPTAPGRVDPPRRVQMTVDSRKAGHSLASALDKGNSVARRA